MRSFLTYILAFFSVTAYAQPIPAIQNDEQALSFVQKIKNDSNYTICLKPPKPLHEPDAKHLPAHELVHYEKADFDNNGQTDLLFNGFIFDQNNNFTSRISLVILAFGEDSFQLHEISRGRFIAFQIVRILPSEENALLSVLHSNYADGATADSLFLDTKTDTLHYYSGKFIEKKTPSRHRIESVRFSHTRPYYLKYQEVDLLIRPDSTKLKAEDFEGYGICTRLYTIITKPVFWNQLTDLLNQIDFANLEAHYEIPWTCDDTGFLTITYNNGKIKTISDYGKSGTYGLEIIEEMLMAISASPEWTLLAEQDGFMEL